MMRLAVFADVHSNIHALKAVLEDIASKEVDEIICAGDLVGYGAFPNEVIEEIKNSNIKTVMGNYDDGVGFQRLICGCDYKDAKSQDLGEKSILWTKKNTSGDNKEFLRSLPHELYLNISGRKIKIVHGSPRRLNEYLFEDFPEGELEKIFSEHPCDILICGHTHLPYKRNVNNKIIINVGSVGKPKNGSPDAMYALIEIDNEVKCEFISVKYDYESAARAIEESELPDEFAEIIRTGKS
ncbi:MAG: phosphoesterase, family [Clostridiales bacterium]|nr:phosphoesterase, family [Clostridiales bacterium]